MNFATGFFSYNFLSFLVLSFVILGRSTYTLFKIGGGFTSMSRTLETSGTTL